MASQFIKALYFSANAHENQRRKNNSQSPYINHPIHVAYLLESAGITDPNVLSRYNRRH